MNNHNMCELYISCQILDTASANDAVEKLYILFTNKLKSDDISYSDIVFVRFFCSDIYTQAPIIEKIWPNDISCQYIYIGQAPLDSSYISLQAYCMQGYDTKIMKSDGSLLIQHGDYKSLYTIDYPIDSGSSCKQSDDVISSLQSKLQQENMSLDINVLRTWYYVRDVDNNYAGMIKSRVSNYETCGLSPETHFIASTGIEACAPRPETLVWMQSLARSGLRLEQITYLKALDNLSPTHAYGVNFERGTRVVYGDRMHGHISGTASIDSEGNVLHKGNVVRQFERAVENVDALLREGEMSLGDLKAATIYLRDIYDYPRIAPIVKAVLPAECAVNITHAPVCRPDWLVELEAEAIAPCKSHYPPFV